MKIKHMTLTLALATCAGALTTLADITTGWRQTETNGTNDKHMQSVSFSEPNNWADGNINGYFGPDLPALFQVLTMSGDYTGSFDFSYSQDYSTLTFRSDSLTPRTITLTDDFYFRPTLASGKGKVTFGDTDARKTVNFDLGGQTRKFFVKYNIFNAYSSFTNGNIVLAGDGGTFNVNGNGYVDGDVDVTTNMTLTVGFMSGNKEGRLGDITLSRSNLAFFKPNGNYTDTIGAIKVKAETGGASSLQLTPNGKTMTIISSKLELEKGAVLAIQQDGGLGTTSIVKFAEPLDTVGGVVPGFVVGASPTAAMNGAPNETYTKIVFAKYDSVNGLAVMTDDDFASEISSEADVNLRVAPGTTVTVEGESSVNSVILDASHYRNSASPKLEGDGRLRVKSGMVFGMGVKTGDKIDVELDFGDRTGYFIVGGAESTSIDITKPIYGENGIVFARLFKTTASDATTQIDSSRQGFVITTTSDEGSYTGNTYIQGPVIVGSSPFLPHGSRKGDVYLNGYLQGDNLTINGLYGNGAYGRQYSSGKTFTLGDNDADGDFAGKIENLDVNAQLIKIGNGTQRFSGTLNIGKEINVNAGKVVLDGTVTQGAVNVKTGAAIGGSGSIATTLAFESGAKLSLTIADDVASCLTVAGAVTGGPVTVNANVTSGKWRTAQRVLTSGTSMGEMTFVKGAGVGSLELRNNGTELWASPKVPGFTIIIR